jgi:hypothetical protein
VASVLLFVVDLNPLQKATHASSMGGCALKNTDAAQIDAAQQNCCA